MRDQAGPIAKVMRFLAEHVLHSTSPLGAAVVERFPPDPHREQVCGTRQFVLIHGHILERFRVTHGLSRIERGTMIVVIDTLPVR